MKECPNCHNKSNSKFCPECGTDLTNIPNIEVYDDSKNTSETSEFHYNMASNDMSRTPTRRKKPVGCIIACLIIIAALTVGGFYFAKYYAIETAKSEMVSYASEMAHTVSDDSNDSDINSCEELINLTNKVWGDALTVMNNKVISDLWEGYSYEDTYNEETKEYVEGISDFNEALERLYSKDEVIAFNRKIIDLCQDASAQKIPDGIPDIKDAYTDLLMKYNNLVDWCIWPSASYNTYMEESQKKYDAFWEALNKFSIVIQQ